MSAPIHIDIISDIVCPWCWVGWRYLKPAIEQSSQAVNVTWRAYMLDANVPKEGMDYKAYMKNKFGDTPNNKFKQMRAHLEGVGPDLGIDFRFDGIPKRANTLAAHQLMYWAQGQNKANEMAEALFQAFFTDHLDINDHNVLVDIAAKLDMDANIVKDLYKKQADETVITNEINEVGRAGIRSVPTYIYQGKYLVQGAQNTNAHMNIINKIATEFVN